MRPKNWNDNLLEKKDLNQSCLMYIYYSAILRIEKGFRIIVKKINCNQKKNLTLLCN